MEVFNQDAPETLNLERLVAEEAERSPPPCEEDSHSQRRPCANNEQKDQPTHSHGRRCAHLHLTQVPKPSGQRRLIIIEKASIPVRGAPPDRRPSVLPMEERIWQPVPKSERDDCDLTPLSKTAQNIYSSTRTSRSRSRWSRILAQIEAANDQHILLRTILGLGYVVGDANKSIKQD